MASKRPALRAVPAPDVVRSRDLERLVATIVRCHIEDACERAWTDVGQQFGVGPLLLKADPSAAAAREAARALAELMTNGLSRLAVAALVLPARERRPRRRAWPEGPPRLSAIPGGLRRNGHAADGTRPDGPPSSR